MPSPIDVIFVPQGAELKAVRRGIARSGPEVALVAVPMGPYAIQDSLKQWLQSEFMTFDHPPKVLLMGLCGSVSPQLGVGDWVLYRDCLDVSATESVPSLACDASLEKTLQNQLGNTVTVVTAGMCDRLIHRAIDKQSLAQRHNVQVIDMEGYAFLSTFKQTGIKVGMLRVVSDDSQHDLPDLAAAITAEGTLNPLNLALGMVAHPLGAVRLIRGSLKGLNQLETMVTQLFQ